MRYERVLKNGIVIASTQPAHAPELEKLQDLVFPTLALAERFREAHYRKHVEIFPEGQFVALDAGRVVGATSSIRRHFDFDHPHHTFAEIIQGGWLTSHEPEGDWLYGVDMGIHPDYRGRGLARALYAARHETVRLLGLKGQIAVGMMRGYGAVKDRMSAEAYFEGLRRGDVTDPTVSAQMGVGFEMRVLIPHHLNDPSCDNYGVLIVLPAAREIRME